MDPITLGVMGGSALLGFLGQQQAAQQQQDAAKKARAILDAVPLPTLKEYYPELYKQVVSIVPEAETYQALGPSAMEQVKANPELKQAQMNALLKLQQIGSEGGMTATDKARLAEIQGQTNAALQGQQGAIMQNLAARGMSGGMSEMVARQLAAQGAANRQAQQGLDVQAQAEQRALQAIMQGGQLGGQISQQDIAQQQAAAQAKDAIAKFNMANLQDIQQRNVAARNAAQQANAQLAQGIQGQNVGLKNQAQQYNLQIPQQQYANQMARATGQAQAAQNLGNLQAGQTQSNLNFLGGLVNTGAQYYGGQQQAQSNADLAKELARLRGGY